MKLAALFSGGKDSAYAVWKAINAGHEVKYLISMISENPDSYMFHYPNVELTLIQSMASGIRLVTKGTKGIKEKELDDLETVLKDMKDIDGIIAGALASKYQKERVEKICKKLGLKLFSPAWGSDPEKYWKELLDNGFKVMITKVACDGLGKEWLGKIIDEKSLEELKKLAKKYRFHLAFEGGEAESFALDTPFFKKKIKITEGKIQWYGDSGIYKIEKIKLLDK
ncbi:MAG: TIGR00289 family protein [Candidatus Aenigmarchaeota archaeon]|nr:TIGR00289 family protein [Candidatus Aenigmarchaeota archaeon]